jgi:hypothetical protein
MCLWHSGVHFTWVIIVYLCIRNFWYISECTVTAAQMSCDCPIHFWSAGRLAWNEAALWGVKPLTLHTDICTQLRHPKLRSCNCQIYEWSRFKLIKVHRSAAMAGLKIVLPRFVICQCSDPPARYLHIMKLSGPGRPNFQGQEDLDICCDLGCRHMYRVEIGNADWSGHKYVKQLCTPLYSIRFNICSRRARQVLSRVFCNYTSCICMWKVRIPDRKH